MANMMWFSTRQCTLKMRCRIGSQVPLKSVIYQLEFAYIFISTCPLINGLLQLMKYELLPVEIFVETWSPLLYALKLENQIFTSYTS